MCISWETDLDADGGPWLAVGAARMIAAAAVSLTTADYPGEWGRAKSMAYFRYAPMICATCY